MKLIDKLHTGLGIWFKGGGGGGGAGEVSYPDYMEDLFMDMAAGYAGGTGSLVTMDLIEAMNTATTGASPFGAVTAYDPDTELSEMTDSLDDFDALIAATLVDAAVDDVVDEYSADLGDRLVAEVLPRFRAGMRDINAVVSSAFALGQAVIEASQTRQVTGFSASAHLKVIDLRLEFQKALTHYVVETNRIKIVAKKEEAETNLEIDEADASWDLEVFQHGANMLASIGGGVANPKKEKKNAMSSAIGGAMTGAAGGAMIGATYGTAGGPWGAAIGAVLGAAAGLLL